MTHKGSHITILIVLSKLICVSTQFGQFTATTDHYIGGEKIQPSSNPRDTEKEMYDKLYQHLWPLPFEYETPFSQSFVKQANRNPWNPGGGNPGKAIELEEDMFRTYHKDNNPLGTETYNRWWFYQIKMAEKNLKDKNCCNQYDYNTRLYLVDPSVPVQDFVEYEKQVRSKIGGSSANRYNTELSFLGFDQPGILNTKSKWPWPCRGNGYWCSARHSVDTRSVHGSTGNYYHKQNYKGMYTHEALRLMDLNYDAGLIPEFYRKRIPDLPTFTRGRYSTEKNLDWNEKSFDFMNYKDYDNYGTRDYADLPPLFLRMPPSAMTAFDNPLKYKEITFNIPKGYTIGSLREATEFTIKFLNYKDDYYRHPDDTNLKSAINKCVVQINGMDICQGGWMQLMRYTQPNYDVAFPWSTSGDGSKITQLTHAGVALDESRYVPMSNYRYLQRRANYKNLDPPHEMYMRDSKSTSEKYGCWKKETWTEDCEDYKKICGQYSANSDTCKSYLPTHGPTALLDRDKMGTTNFRMTVLSRGVSPIGSNISPYEEARSGFFINPDRFLDDGLQPGCNSVSQCQNERIKFTNTAGQKNYDNLDWRFTFLRMRQGN